MCACCVNLCTLTSSKINTPIPMGGGIPSAIRWALKASNRLALSRRCSSLIPGELACLYMYPLSVLSQGSCKSPIERTAWYAAGLREKIANATKFNNLILVIKLMQNELPSLMVTADQRLDFLPVTKK